MQERISEREKEREQSPFWKRMWDKEQNYIKEDESKNIEKKMYSCKHQIIQVMLCNKIILNHFIIS